MTLDCGYLKNREEIDMYGITFDLDTGIMGKEDGNGEHTRRRSLTRRKG